jgi:signal transduction histidine kinase
MNLFLSVFRRKPFLNIGLKLLTDDIHNSEDPKDADRNDILSDANSACRTALDILNDLLCFDKLENGVLVLHRQEEPVLSFIFDCVAMFSSQARECGVNLSIINPDLQHYVDSALKSTDMVFMDKFKMDQVLRNLISNALKFTRRGGTVNIHISSPPLPNLTGLLCLLIYMTSIRDFHSITFHHLPLQYRLFPHYDFSRLINN